jgi:CotH kinase protein/Lamin Tail Domain
MRGLILLSLAIPAAAQGPLISEFQAANSKTLADEDGDASDWIELHNPGAAPIDLSGWYLSDDGAQLQGWEVPAGVVLGGGEFRVVFASGKDRVDPGAELHTDFKLKSDGEFLALVRPDGVTVEHDYGPAFPKQYTDASFGLVFDPGPLVDTSFFNSPTPGAANGAGGPLVLNPSHAPALPGPGDDLTLGVYVPEDLGPAGAVNLTWRVNFDPEQGLALLDDGLGPDAVAGDNIYSAVLPHTAWVAGDLLRWAITADDGARQTRVPPFLHPGKSAEYLGVGIADPAVQSDLPVFTFWVEDLPGSNTLSGARGGVMFEDEYYDNVFVRRRGASSGFYSKKSYKFDFNPDQRLGRGDGPRADEVNLNTTWADKSFVRQPLSFELYQLAGCTASDSFPVRVQRNGEFFSVAIFVEEPGEEAFLERHGRDPEGALYKMANPVDHHKLGVSKKTRLYESHADLKKLVEGLATTDPAALELFLFDNVDVDACLSYLAATWLVHDNDHVVKNYYLYRDSDGTREWEFIPWDKDLTWGRNFTLNGGVLNDVLWARLDPFSHPLFGDKQHPKIDGLWNRLIDRLYRVPRIREMYLARLRYFADRYLGPPDVTVAQAWPEQRLVQLLPAMAPDVALDQAKWGIPSWGQPYDMRTDSARLVTKYLRKRRVHLYVDHGPTGSGLIPPANPFPPVSLGDLVGDPGSGKALEEYVTLLNPGPAADLSGWRVQGGISLVFPEGTLIDRSGVLFLSPSPFKFRARGVSPKGGEGHHVLGPYNDLLETGEWVRLFDRDGNLVDQRQF